MTSIAYVGHFESQNRSVCVCCALRMVKSCCAPGCENCWSKGSGLSFYHFPADPVRRAQWGAAVSRKNWEPTEYSRLCSVHFVSGSKSNDKLSPDYMPSIFSHTNSPIKRKAERNVHAYTRRKEARRRRSEALNREAVSGTDLLSLVEGDTETLEDDEGSNEVETTCLLVKDAATMTDMNFINLEEECCHLYLGVKMLNWRRVSITHPLMKRT